MREYLDCMKAGITSPPPSILIELYFTDTPDLAILKGTNNSRRDNVPGIKLIVEFNEEYTTEYNSYVANPNVVRTVPVEYYAIRLRTFADSDITPRAAPIKPTLIDASTIRSNAAASRYLVDIVRDSLTKKEQVDIALSYRLMRDRFLDDATIANINAELAKKTDTVSNKNLSISLDTSSRNGWETSVMPQLDEIPMTLAGKGEQNSIKVRLALESSEDSHLVLIEEAENHLSHSKLNSLIDHISTKRGNRQILITTHSSFVLNKLGVESVLLFSRTKNMTLKKLSPDTEDYFMKLPGHDTLRLILAERTILVEGPSDELIVQAAFNKKHGKMPLAAGVDVISVRSLAFKRFLEIASSMNLRVDVVTDNDGDIEALKRKYGSYLDKERIKIHYDVDVAYPTLEPQLLKANGISTLNAILKKDFKTEDEILKYMQSNKAETALMIFESNHPWKTPSYIEMAIA